MTEQSLLPQVHDASLKALIERMRTAVSGHLQDAECIRSRLGANERAHPGSGQLRLADRREVVA